MKKLDEDLEPVLKDRKSAWEPARGPIYEVPQIPVWGGLVTALGMSALFVVGLIIFSVFAANPAFAESPVWWEDPSRVTGPNCESALANGEGRYRITSNDTLRGVFDDHSPAFNSSWEWFTSLNAHIENVDRIEPGLCVWISPPTAAVLTAIKHGALDGYSQDTLDGLERVIDEKFGSLEALPPIPSTPAEPAPPVNINNEDNDDDGGDGGRSEFERIAAQTDIAPIAVSAYINASEMIGQVSPGCSVRPAILAGIGKKESNHGTFPNGATIAENGDVRPLSLIHI